jgi:hypothetical protein
MIDAIDPGQYTATVAVPGAGVQSVALRAGYVNGRWPTAVQIGAEVTIDVNGSRPDADVLDIEVGDATPASAPGWVRAHNSGGRFPAVLYCNRSTMGPVANACSSAGLQAGRDYKWWIATLDGTQRVPDMTGVAAVQVWGAQFFGGRNIDLSIVYDDSWHGTGAPDMEIGELYAWRDDHGRNLIDFANFTTGVLDSFLVILQDLQSRVADVEAKPAGSGLDPAAITAAVNAGVAAALKNIHVVTGP